MRRSFLVLALLWAAGGTPRAEGDALRRLETDPSVSSVRRLVELSRSVRDGDQRFWVVQALGARLKARGEAEAFEALLRVGSEDPDPQVRGAALRALAESSPLDGARVSRLERVARAGADHPSGHVRRGARELERALESGRRDDGPSAAVEKREASAAVARGVGGMLRVFGWTSAAVVPVLALVWAAGGRSKRRKGGLMSVVKQVVSTDKAPAAIGPYSQAVRSGSLLFVSGQLPLDPATGNIVSGGVPEQTRRVIDNLSAVLEGAGLDLRAVVKTTVFLKDMASFGEMNAVYQERFEAPFPARAAVEVAALPKGALVEIEVVAATGR